MIDARSSAWEEACAAFETAEEAEAKCVRRLRRLGAASWDRNAVVLELFCGSGAGLAALTRLGFDRVHGIDLSRTLVARYRGPAMRTVADCRTLPVAAASRDVVVVHGGLHHLSGLVDLERVLVEIRRVLRREGRFCAVEPWPTPFLRLVRFVAEHPLARRLSRKLDAFQTMVEREIETYERWLGQPREIEALLLRYFEAERLRSSWGFLEFVGRPRSPGVSAAACPAC